MRVALLYSGLPRMWDGCVQQHRALFPDATIDVFCHFWDTAGPAEKSRLIETLRPAAWAFETLPDFAMLDTYAWLRSDAINAPSRMVSQYTSWQKAGTMFAPFAPLYDVAVRIRTDLDFHKPLKVDLDGIAGKRIGFIGYEWTETQGVLFDAFALGQPNFIVHFHMLLSRLWDYAAEMVLNPEYLITRHVQSYPEPATLQLITELPFFIRRPHMAGWTAEQCLAEDIGRAKWRDPEIYAAHRAAHARRFGAAGVEHVDQFRAERLGSAG